MGTFELIDRDGLARLGRLETPHGRIETPALLPVIHPDPHRQPVPPVAMRSRLGLRAVITSAYIVWRTPPLRETAERDGVHRLIGFDGPVMTDSGAFQQHAYGSVEVDHDAILGFQETIGSDIATVLDVFTEPEATHEEAEAALATTLTRARAARSRRSGLLAVPVQGGRHDDLRAASAREAGLLGDVLAVGGVVPWMEQYRFPELVRALAAARPALDPSAAVHLFGSGHPMTFALAALFGVDLFDSSAYHKFARRGSLLFPEGTIALDEIVDPICRCFLCEELPLPELAHRPAPERERHLAFHNLLTSAEEVARVRRAIRDGTLWELAERRASAHPALRAAMREALRHPTVFFPTEPESRRAFREVGPESRERPAVVRFLERVNAFAARRPAPHRLGRIALRPEYLSRIPERDRSDRPIAWEVTTPLGPIPLELLEVYPVGPYLGVDEFASPPRHRPPSEVEEEVRGAVGDDADLSKDWAADWTRRQTRAALEWRYGEEVAGPLVPGVVGERSRRTGRLRTLRDEAGPLFHVGTDGVVRPTFRGGTRLLSTLARDRERVTVAEDAVEFVARGRSLFARFVRDVDRTLVPGSSALLVDRSDALLAVGRLLLAPHEMARMTRGVAARVTAHAHAPETPEPEDEAPVPDR